MDQPSEDELQSAVATEFLALADLLEPLPEEAWDTPSLCDGWRIREVAAHMTMAARYSPPEFMAELQACGGDFARLSNVLASRDAALPTSTLVGNLRDETMHRWVPPGGGYEGALTHVVIHGLDMTVPLGISRPPDEAVRLVLELFTRGGFDTHFGFDLEGLHLQATDMNWIFGTGAPITGRAGDLVLLMAGRTLPPGRIQGDMPRPRAGDATA